MDRLIVFLKAPCPGKVKTRLAAELDGPAAAAIYRVLVERTLAVVSAIAELTEVELRFAPADALAEIRPWVREGWRTNPQADGDLGRRLESATREAFDAGARKVLVIGSDCPALHPDDLRSALEALTKADLVLGPATDGGYWLVGMKAPRPQLFSGIPWSTRGVFDATLERAREEQLLVHPLRMLRDVDTLEDWREWLRTSPA